MSRTNCSLRSFGVVLRKGLPLAFCSSFAEKKSSQETRLESLNPKNFKTHYVWIQVTICLLFYLFFSEIKHRSKGFSFPEAFLVFSHALNTPRSFFLCLHVWYKCYFLVQSLHEAASVNFLLSFQLFSQFLLVLWRFVVV